MRISIIGGAGFVGAHLVPALLGQRHQIQVYDNLFSRGQRADLSWRSDVRFAHADITDGRRLQAELSDFDPEVIFHLAALHYIPYCDRHPEEVMRVNVEGTLQVMLAAKKAPALKGLVFASSVAVYAGDDIVHRESDVPRPSDIYGLTKLLGEQVVEQYAQELKASHLSLRLANIYGAGETNPHVIPEVLQQLLSGCETLHLGCTDRCRDFLYIDDLVEALVAAIPVAASQNLHETVNVGPGREWAVRDAIDILCQLSGKRVQVIRDSGRVRQGERMHLRVHIERACQLLSWEPKHDLHAGLKKTFAYEQARHNLSSAAASGA